jgi:hypothetical protein
VLAPVCAKTPDQQAEFYRRFDAWRTPTATDLRPTGPAEEVVRKSQVWMFTLLATFAMAAVAIAAILIKPPTPVLEPRPSPPPPSTASPEPAPPSSGRIRIREMMIETVHLVERPGYQIVKAGLIALPPAAYSAWLLLRWRRRRLWLERGTAEAQVDPADVHLPRTLQPLFAAREFRGAAQELRRHWPVPTADLDAEQTVRATAEAAGAFTPVWRMRPRSPEYLFLIERESAHDHVVRLLDLALDRLRDEEVTLERFYFQGSPDVVQKEDPMRTSIALAELSDQASGQRLVVLGTADGFFRPLSNRLEPQIKRALAPWDTRYILSTRPLPEWSWRELSLLEGGYSLGTASQNGFAALARHLKVDETEAGQLLEGVLVRVPPRSGLRPPTGKFSPDRQNTSPMPG